MANTTSPFADPAPVVHSVPALPGALPLIGDVLRFRSDRLALHEEAARFAPITRLKLLNIPVYIVTDADAAKEILVDNADKFLKAAGIQQLAPVLGNGLLNAEGEVHKKHRKLLAPAFAPKRMNAYAEVMIEETRTQVASWTPGRRVDLSHEMMELTLAIAGKTMFGADVRKNAHTVGEALDLAMRAVITGITSPFQLDYKWPLPRHLQMRKAVKMLDEIVYKMIADGRKAGTDRGDVLSVLLQARDEEDGSVLDDRQIRDEVMTLLLAGHETTANALTWTFYELGKNPAALAKLEEEISRVIGDRQITPDDLQKMPYNLGVIEETMRLHPPAYLIGRQASEDVVIAGHKFPRRSILLVNTRGIQRRSDYWPAPLAFRPERMFADQKKARPRHQYMPFGAGPRVCIGSHFALLEAQLLLATMNQRAKVKTLATHVEAEPLVTLRPRGGLPAIVGPKS
ncbi:MAG TPA: cytochrome P450 [Kofleriaceae bacterium]|jgi:cytochrome P450